MIKVIFLCLLITFSGTISPSNTIKKPEVFAQSYVMMDAITNQVMEEKNPRLVRSVASISKIMTAIIAIESGKLSHNVTIDDEIKTVYGSMIYASVGDVYSLEELVYGLMLRSGNDAAVMIAKYVAGSVPKFIDKMNEKAQALKMRDTTFVNPHGLDEKDGGNLSTAYDMALLMSYASKNEIFTRISGSESYQSSLKGRWENKNRLLSLYDKTIAGKTGYTKHAKRTLATAAKSDNTHFVVVTLNCGNDFSFHKELYEYYFATLERRVILPKGEHIFEGYRLVLDEDLTYQMPKQNWANYSYLVQIIEDQLKCNVYLIKDKEQVHLLHSNVSVVEPVKENSSWFQQFLHWLKEVF